ncbi:MAG: lipoprotein ABC transporter ATP-binding protein [Sphingobacteriia bacterium 35-40-8]|nr:MAG: lipoprotein ABC transporter ATP-binding protein [Sphingobacteriia bacterium 35-40-8]
MNKGEIVSILGSSGAGKSSLLHILGTLDKADTGTITINNQSVEGLKGKELAAFRNKHIGFVFQFHHLLPEFSALENVCIPGWIAGRKRKEVQDQAAELLEKLGMGNRKEHKPQELSGGEQQRVAVARALINQPVIVFADEPTGNLDSKNAKELHDLFVSLRNEFQQTFLIVTHNEELAAMSDRSLFMRDGLIIQP